jgi:hypothetical protein
MAKAWKQMFLSHPETNKPPERTWITDMDPSFLRIKAYKTKQCKDYPGEKLKQIKEQEQLLTMKRLSSANAAGPGILSAGVNSIFELEMM